MKCTACGGKPNLIRFFPNVIIGDYDPDITNADAYVHRGPTICPHCDSTGVEPGTTPGDEAPTPPVIESKPGWESD